MNVQSLLFTFAPTRGGMEARSSLSPQKSPCLVIRSNHMMEERQLSQAPATAATFLQRLNAPQRIGGRLLCQTTDASSALKLNGGEACELTITRGEKPDAVALQRPERWRARRREVVWLEVCFATLCHLIFTSSCWHGEDPPTHTHTHRAFTSGSSN